MPLMPNMLALALKNIKDPSGPEAAADAWADAWWTFAQMCIQLVPGPGTAAKAAFKGMILSAFMDNKGTASAFCDALEGAMTMGWSACILLPLYTPPLIFVPQTLKPSLQPVMESNLNATDPSLARELFALPIYTWTITIQATLVVGGTTPLS
jgi:hypothetical protein